MYASSDTETTSTGKRNQLKLFTCYYPYVDSNTFVVNSKTDKVVWNSKEAEITEVIDYSNVETDIIDPYIQFTFEEV